jgi:hypothetical protein
MLTIVTALRLKRGHHHPVRLPRLDDLSFFIPELLASDKESFIKEFIRQTAAKQQVLLAFLIRGSCNLMQMC